MRELDKYEKKYKSFLKMQRRLDEIEDELRKLPLRELKEPYQKGWNISIRLRDDISRREDAHIIQQIVDLGWHKENYTTDIEAVKAVRKGLKSYICTKYKEPVSISLFPLRKDLTEEQYNNLPEKVKLNFRLDNFTERYLKYNRKYYYCHLPNYYTELKVRPNIITHERLKGGELESEKDFLRGKLQEFYRIYYYGYKRINLKSERRIVRDEIQKFKKGENEDIFLSKKQEYNYY